MRTIAAILAILSVGGCTMDDGEAPSLTGPSEFGLSVAVTASPDRLPRDGSSQAVVTVTVRNVSSQPVSGQHLNVYAAIGTLTSTEIVTGSDGRATFAFVAPPPGTLGSAAEIQIFPAGTDARNDAARTLIIGFTGAANLSAPDPDFQTTPEDGKIEVNQSVRFDASRTTDEPIDATRNAPCLDRCTYHWDFGDGSTASGRVVNHAFSVARTHSVTLTVTDEAGSVGSMVKTVTVNFVAPPEVTLTVSPDPPFVSQQAVLTAIARAAPGHSIQRYEWSFGDGTTETTTGPTVVKTYDTVGIYVATVAAYDDLGQVGRAAKTMIVGHTVVGPVANFTISPSSPSVGVNVTFDGSTSTVGTGATIVSYVWNPGDGGPSVDSGATSSIVGTYGSAGTFVVTLTITDSLGRQATKTVSLTVVP